jgi:hypothetical protein
MIRPASPRWFLFAALSTSLLAAACGGDDHSTAKFTGADTAHLDRALQVASGRDLASVWLVGAFVAGANQQGCPSIVTVNSVTTVTGGCTNEDGARLDGKFIITNVQGIFSSTPSYDPSKAGTVVAQGWKVTNAGGAVESVDGTVTITNTGGVADNGGVVAGSVDTRLDGIDAHTEAAWSCDVSDLCSYTADSWFDIDGVGAATLSGQFRFDDPRTGSIVATGAEILTIDVAASTDECQAFRIGDGAVQTRCEPADPNAKRAAGIDRRWLRSLGR